MSTISAPGIRDAVARVTVDDDELRTLAHKRDSFWSYAPSRAITFEYSGCLETCLAPLEVKDGTHQIEEAFVAEIANVDLVGDSAVPILPDNRILLENLNRSSQHLARSIFSAMLDGRRPYHTGKKGNDRKMGRVVSLVGPWAREYFHWFSEWLPRLEGVVHYTDQTGHRPRILIPTNPPKWMVESLQLVGFDEETWTEWHSERQRVDRLVVPSLRRAHPVDDPAGGYTNSPDGYRWVRKRVLDRLEVNSTAFSSRIYISRAGADERRVRNEKEVLTALEKRGFESYQLETLPFADQVAMFKDADIVVGPHGAGLVNAIFSTDLSLVELFGSYVNACYFTLAESLDFRYECLSCTPQGSDMVVDVDQLCTVVDSLLD